MVINDNQRTITNAYEYQDKLKKQAIRKKKELQKTCA